MERGWMQDGQGPDIIAGTSIGQNLAQDEAIKVICVRGSAAKVDKADVQR